jgi:hypothetical protein
MRVVSTILICIAVPAVLRWIYSRSSTGRALPAENRLVFPESKIVPIIRWTSTVLFSGAAIASWLYTRSILATLLFGGFAISAALFARGDRIIIDDVGISGASTWGRKASLAWSDVASLQFNVGQRTIMVIGKEGSRICHSGFHLDPPRFEEEVKRRTGLQMKVVQPGLWKPKIYYR